VACIISVFSVPRAFPPIKRFPLWASYCIINFDAQILTNDRKRRMEKMIEESLNMFFWVKLLILLQLISLLLGCFLFWMCILIVFPPSFVAEIIFILMRICFGVGGGIELPSFVTCNKTHSLDLNS